MDSWLTIEPKSDFSLSNVPFGIFSPDMHSRPRCGTAVGSFAVDLSLLADAGLFDTCTALESPSNVFFQETLNDFLAHPRDAWVQVRTRIIDLFSEGGSRELRENQGLKKAVLHELKDIKMYLPVKIGDYTDFYSSREHATNVGTMFRGKENALQPNWLHLPVGYHGRASSVFVSGTPITRPCGQLQKNPADPKEGSVFGPTRLFDFELEMAFFVGGPPNRPGQRLSALEAYNRIFGFVLMNDWSARDIQRWEYIPLGPFTSKNFGTTISPWVVTTMALENFRCATSAKKQDSPIPLEYLQDPNYGSYDISLEVAIQGESMSHPETICKSNFANLYWNATQQLIHHSVTGCNMLPGDLIASGTISGMNPTSYGSMLELTWKGSHSIKLGSTGGERKFLMDGDTVVMKGWSQKDGCGRVGFGRCSGKVLPAWSQVETSPRYLEHDELQKQIRYQNFKLYSFWKSSASWRVRLALAAKNIPYEYEAVDLSKSAQTSSYYAMKNPMEQVPVLEFTDAKTKRLLRMTQSIAIIEFLDEAMPGPRLLPQDPVARAAAREAAEVINAGTQPLQNIVFLHRIEKLSEGKIVASEFGAAAIKKGLGAMEVFVSGKRNSSTSGPFALGGFSPTIADFCIVPQLFNARLMHVNVELFPTLLKIENACRTHRWFAPAHPNAQPDAPK